MFEKLDVEMLIVKNNYNVSTVIMVGKMKSKQVGIADNVELECPMCSTH